MSRLRLQQAPSGDHIGVTGGGGWDGGWEQGDQCGGHYKSLQDTQCGSVRGRGAAGRVRSGRIRDLFGTCCHQDLLMG